MSKRLSVRGTLVLLVLVFTALNLALVVHSSIAEQEAALDKIRTRLRIQAQLRAASQERLIEGVRHLLAVLSHAPQVLDGNPQECSEYLRDLNEHFPQYANLGFADSVGNLVCRSAPGSDVIYVGDRQYFKGALRTEQFTIGEYLISRISGRAAIAFSSPVFRRDGALHGVLYAVVDMAGIDKEFEMASEDLDATHLMTDGDGIVLAVTAGGTQRVGEPVSPKFLADAVRSREAMLGEAVDGNEEWIYAVEPVAAKGAGSLVLATFASRDSILGPAVHRLQNELALLMGIALASTLLVWHMADRLLARPIGRMLLKVNALKRGDAEPRSSSAPAPRVRELMQIDESIDALAAALALRSTQRDEAISELQAQKQALEASEKRYRARFESSPQPMWVFDSDTLAFLVVNDAAVAHYGYSREEFMRMTLTDISPSEKAPAPKELSTKHEPEPPIVDQGLVRHRRKNGEIIHVEYATHALDWEGLRARASIVYDVTSRELARQAWTQLHKTLELKVAQRTRELELANEELEAFSYSASHDLRGPIQIIEGFCGVLAEKHGNELTPQAAHYVERIRAASQRMNALVEDLLSLARTGRAALDRQPVSIAAAARTTVDRLRQQFPDRRVTVEIDEPLTADCDPALLEVLLDNLIGNAWKFTSRTAEASIRVGTSGEAADGAIFFVSDNGAGFDTAHAAKLFKPFERLHTQSEFPGTGIGLTIVHRIIGRQGGRVWAESEVGKGATFFFTLPAAGIADRRVDGDDSAS